jgi:hypothetical protein
MWQFSCILREHIMQTIRRGNYVATRDVLNILTEDRVYTDGLTQVSLLAEGDAFNEVSVIIAGDDGITRAFDDTFFKFFEE